MQAFTKNAHQMYFLYGSNAHPKQIAARCGRAERIGVARLADHRLAFFGHSGAWDSGEETVTESPGDEVWGVLCRLLIADADRFDGCQGVRTDGCGTYFLLPVTVWNESGEACPALAYKRDFCGNPAFPSRELIEFIAEGAAQQNFPQKHIASLRQTDTRPARYPVPKGELGELRILPSCGGCV